MNLGTLNTIIALVVVLLVLSLIVQSIQTGLKKLLSLKSKQIEQSIRDLYDQAIAAGPRSVSGSPAGATAISRAATPPGSATPRITTSSAGTARVVKIWSKLLFLIKGVKQSPTEDAKEFTKAILDEFASLGRVNRYGKPVLDSLAKDDLLKVMSKLELKEPFAGQFLKFEELCSEVKSLSNSIEILANNQELVASLSAQISKLRTLFAPLVEDVDSLKARQAVNSKVVFGDLLQLSSLNADSILGLISETQKAVQAEKERSTASSPATPEDQKALDALNAVEGELTKISKAVGDVCQTLNEAVAPLRAKVNQVETWFDTVTQSFDERYTRHMKTVSICISAVVVILLNANFFQIYRSISTSEVQKNLIADAGAKILDKSRQAKEAAEKNGSTSDGDVKKEMEATKAEIDAYVGTYEQFGFTPVSTAQFKSWLWGIGGWTYLWKPWNEQHPVSGWTVKREKGVPVNVKNQLIYADCRPGFDDCDPAWRPQTGLEWWAALKSDITVLVGWAVMVLLLSVGAPFWQDTLESLFGVKNLIRQKSQTQNIEEKSGTGQPKQA